MYYPAQSRITALTTIRRERLLPVPGQVLVSVGETVGPADVVARCQMPGEIRVVDICRALGIPRSRVAGTLRKAAGDAIQVNEVLAAPGGLFAGLRKSCRSPVDGQVVEIRDNLVLIEAAATNFELRAHMKGQVTSVMPNRGVVISATGAVIQAAWGSGGEAEGILKVVVDSPQKPLRPRAIDVSCHGTIVVGGRILEEEVLAQAVDAKVRGLIVGGANASLIDVLEALPFPVLITEGFGTVPMAQPAFSLLQSNTGREAMLNADTRTRRGAVRPEIIIPLRAEEEMPGEDSKTKPLQAGDRVRALRAPYLGTLGTVADIPQQLQTLESGARMRVAAVRLEDGEQALIPLANLELIA